MPSFDVVSEVDKQEVDNALNQARKEIGNRYDFRNSKTDIQYENSSIKLLSDDDYKVKAVQDVILGKMIKRGVDAKALDFGKIEPGPGGGAKCEVKVKEGIDQDTGKKIVKSIKETKMKVQAQIQDNQVRVTGKKRDDLQEAISLLKSKDFGVPLQFTNFRD
ncbi:MAG: YajQ family cyclic di-GMP-binding protein [bacterium]|nr:YajQ family cyclic di-GMP-binding protein [bacterium]